MYTRIRRMNAGRLLAVLLIVAGLVAVVIVGQEAWNGMVKSDMAPIPATRDVSQS